MKQELEKYKKHPAASIHLDSLRATLKKNIKLENTRK